MIFWDSQWAVSICLMMIFAGLPLLNLRTSVKHIMMRLIESSNPHGKE